MREEAKCPNVNRKFKDAYKAMGHFYTLVDIFFSGEEKGRKDKGGVKIV